MSTGMDYVAEADACDYTEGVKPNESPNHVQRKTSERAKLAEIAAKVPVKVLSRPMTEKDLSSLKLGNGALAQLARSKGARVILDENPTRTDQEDR